MNRIHHKIRFPPELFFQCRDLLILLNFHEDTIIFIIALNVLVNNRLGRVQHQDGSLHTSAAICWESGIRTLVSKI